MSSRRRAEIDRSATFDEDDAPTVTMKDADAALYGALARVDGKRKAIERTRFGAFKITPVGLEIGEGAEEKDWKEAGQFIFQVESGIQWLIGDWLVYGVALKYGEMPRIAEMVGRDEATLHTYKQMSENIESTRRRVDLTFGHHQVVRALNPDEQDQALAHAAKNGLSVAAFRQYLRGEQPVLPVGDDHNIDTVTRDLKKFIQRDPITLKPNERTLFLGRIAEMERLLADAKRRLGEA